MRVAAVVVTFNRSDLLQRSLAAIEKQSYLPEKLFVIDNASTDSTPEILKSRQMKLPTAVHRLAKNTGGAGGFFYGMDVAYSEGYDAFWIMDDDTIPREDTLEKLVQGLEKAGESRGELPSYAASMVVWKDGNACYMNLPTVSWDGVMPLAREENWLNLDCCSFVSCLVTREAVKQCGLPYPEYFIWFDDAEYTYRLAKWREGIFVPDSICDHWMPNNAGVYWGEVTEDNFWKFSRGARNQVSAAMSLRKLRILADLFQGMVSQLRTSPAPLKLKLKLVRAALSGFAQRPCIRYPRAERK